MASLWSYEENDDVEQLGEKLMCTTLELEKLKAEAMEEMRKNKDYIDQLMELLKCAIHERDEAINQFQKLLNQTMPADTFPSILLNPTRANSTTNSLSETYNLQTSHGSSPVDAAASSPDFSNFNLVVKDSNAVDQASLIIDNLATPASLPEKGKFLQAVVQAGPLLQTLLVAGPVPRWRNPPQFQPFQIPPRLQLLSCSSAQVHSEPMLSFGASLTGGSWTSPPPAMNTNGYPPSSKRQRFSSF